MTRIPALGPKGEGWVALQLLLVFLVAVIGAMNLPSVARGPVSVPALAAGILLLLIGGWLVLSGLRGLGPSLTAFPCPRQDATLVRSGVYGRIRHPIYAGLIAAGLGWALLTLSLGALVAAAALVVVLDLKARREEAWLTARYPDYAAYQRTTHRFLPGVY